ncbi:uncharacterized protein LOC125231338 [Leguminivora glycinivorella]|uniref:uncharacterized protein LOC125231338 n=1 Tax=Leguminivora glycinivorella TaxID=1035111 RepID=UPI00200E1983|nr:uncharacterized protein LOC125231338 [Leguminivora glycinivorella]
MKKVTVVLVTALAVGSLGFLIKVPDIQQPTIKTSSMGWIHMQKLLLPLFDNVCEESADPTIVRLAQEFTLDSIADKYTDPEMVNNLKKLYSVNGQLQKGEIFTELNQDHMFEFQLLYDVLYNAQTFDTFYKTAAWARQNVNCGLFVNAIYLAILKRRDTEKITVPAPYELLPHYFIRQDVIIKASSLLAGEDVPVSDGIVNEGNSYILDANYTCNMDASGESKLAYFHEDVGLNTYYFLKRIQYAPWFNTEDVNSNHAEFMYHFMKQLNARYNLERYSNGLTILEKFDWSTCNVDSYDPMLVFSNGQGFTPRLSGLDITGLNILQNIEDNIIKIVPTMVQNGYTKSQIISKLMNLLVTNLENYESVARRFFGGVATENRSVLAHYMTSLRDPVSWKIIKKIVDVVDEALKSLPGYIRNELYFPGVQILNVEVKKVNTMFEPFKFEVTDALRTSIDRPMFDVNVVESRLNHKPFTLKLNISSLVSQKGLVKIYLGPKILPGEFAAKKDLFMLLDSFECNLKIGSNVISRTSNAIERTSEDFISLKVLRKLVEDAEFGLDVKPLNSLENLSGFPSRLLLPKGTPEGLPMELLIFVAPYVKVTAAGINVTPKTEFNSATLSPGYPFDLNLDDKLFISLPNVLVKDIIITHKDSSGANKGEYDGSKKWDGSGKPNTYGPKREPFDYNLKKTQYGKSQDYEPAKDDHATIPAKLSDEVVTDNVQVTKDYDVDGQSDLNPEAEDGFYMLSKEPYALRLRSSPYEKYDYEARKQKYNYEEKRNKYTTRNEEKRTKYYNRYILDRTPKPDEDKLEDKININEKINRNFGTLTVEDDNSNNIESVADLHPKTTWGNNIGETDDKRVIPINEPASTSNILAPAVAVLYHLEFANTVWKPYHNIHIERLERIQRKFLKTLDFRTGHTHMSPHYYTKYSSEFPVDVSATVQNTRGFWRSEPGKPVTGYMPIPHQTLDTDDDQKMAMLRKAFQMFDTTKSGYIDVLKISTILNTMGQLFDDSELQALIDENDPETSGKINFDGFCNIASHFLEEEDAEAMQQELKEAFRLYDREGNGYITTSTLKEILAALDDKLSNSDLDGIIAEIDTDGSGTVDFDATYNNTRVKAMDIHTSKEILATLGHKLNNLGSMVRRELNRRGKMFLWILLLVTTTASAPAEEYGAIVNEGEFADDASIMKIVPSGFSPQKNDYFIKPALAEVVSKDKSTYKRMLDILKKGHTSLGLTFNIYDDNMREATVALYRLLLDVDDDKFDVIERWARVNINKDMFDYAWRLASLYGNKFKKEEMLPPFIKKPNHFVNSETMWKAMHLKLGNGMFNEEDAKLNQYYRSDDVLFINTNYSGWNLPQNGCDREINYLKEDIALNSYYHGVHLLHPFWMSNDDLDLLNPRHAEHYYFTHKQLMARYQLEKEHLNKDCNETCDINQNSYNSYLMHDYGLPFPIKSSNKEWNDGRARLKSIDIAIRECISRGLLVDSNGTTVPMAGEYNIDLLSKLVRANLDSLKSVKIIRSIYGYGGNGYPIDWYNPAPSVMHFPHTSLRDQTYWHLLKSLMEYFTEYKKTLDSLDLSQYQNKNFAIIDNRFSNITTYFEYYKFSLNKGLGGGNLQSPLVFAARQRRLNHLPFMLNFTLDSTTESDVIVRLFLGPLCNAKDCWQMYDRFFELDAYRTQVKQGLNVISWSSETSDKFSSDDYYNMETSDKKNNKFNLFKFPKNLVIPKGQEQGLNLTLFIMITHAEKSSSEEVAPISNYYSQVLHEVDKKPLGFPFHRQVIAQDECFENCKFYNVTIYHKASPVDSSGYFSSNLY